MTGVIFGLVGVVVGALATGGTTLFLQRRNEKLDFRQAVRLVIVEVGRLGMNAMSIAQELSNGSAKRPPLQGGGAYFGETYWLKYADVLAGPLDDLTWKSLGSFYYVIENLQGDIGRMSEDEIPVDHRPDYVLVAESAVLLIQQLGDEPPRTLATFVAQEGAPSDEGAGLT